MRIFRYGVPALVVCLLFTAPAYADPVSAVATLFVYALGEGAAIAVATFIVNTAISLAISAVATALFTPKNKSGNQERQAAVTSISIGERAPEVIYGRALVGGGLADAYNYGGDYQTDWEVLVIILADHIVEALEGFYVNDDYYAYTGNGLQSAFEGALDIEFVNASRTAPPSRFASVSLGRWGPSDVLAGRTRVWVAYKADEKVWSGRPQFRWLIKGRKCIDPRNPGAGRVWTENAAVCRYDYQRGVYAEDRDTELGQLLIGRGLPYDDLAEARAITHANICDEPVMLDSGETEPRYRVGGVVVADDPFDAVEEMFAAAMAGQIIQREGGVDVEPGVAKSITFQITDDDLVSPEMHSFSDFLPEPDRVNTVIPRYVEPAQGWKDHSAPVRRDPSDIAQDGGPLEETLSLSLVTSGTQAGRVGEIYRILGRLEKRAAVVVGPRFAFIEDGDWGTYTSAVHTGGQPLMVRCEAYSQDEGWRMALGLREISAEAYGEATEIPDTTSTDTPQTPPMIDGVTGVIVSSTVTTALSASPGMLHIAAQNIATNYYPFSVSLPAEDRPIPFPGRIYVYYSPNLASYFTSSNLTTYQFRRDLIYVGNINVP